MALIEYDAFINLAVTLLLARTVAVVVVILFFLIRRLVLFQ